MTIEQIQEMITNKGDVREIINQLADYIQANPGGAPGGDQLLQSATVTLTDAQIKALPTTPIQLVAAPGIGVSLCPILIHISKNFISDYTNVNTTSAYLGSLLGSNPGTLYATNDSGVTPPESLLSSLLAAGTSVFTLLTPNINNIDTRYMVSVPYTGTVNAALLTDCGNNGAGNFTGGNSANVMKFTILYTIIQLP